MLQDQATEHGLRTIGWVFTFNAAAYNLVRIRNLLKADIAQVMMKRVTDLSCDTEDMVRTGQR